MAIERFQGSVEIGHVTVAQDEGHPRGYRSGVAAAENAFEHQYRRLEWKCDSMNIASRNAAERLGFVWEGRLRQKLVRKGRNRDSDMLSIIDGEWPERMRLCGRLAAENFDGKGGRSGG